MRRSALELGVLLLFVPLACASLSQERRDYILAHPHGWVEVSIDDREIPNVPKSEDEPGELVRPESCGLQAKLDGEPFLHDSVYPAGDAPPYSAKSGFRFPAPLGAARLSVSYSGCDVEKGAAVVVTVEAPITVEEDRVTEVLFDGRALAPQPSREDSVLTLEDLYDAITGPPETAPK